MKKASQKPFDGNPYTRLARAYEATGGIYDIDVLVSRCVAQTSRATVYFHAASAFLAASRCASLDGYRAYHRLDARLVSGGATTCGASLCTRKGMSCSQLLRPLYPATDCCRTRGLSFRW